MNEASDFQIAMDIATPTPLPLCAVPLFALFGLWRWKQFGQILKRSWVSVLQVYRRSLPQPNVLHILDEQRKNVSRILKCLNFKAIRKQVRVCGASGNLIFMVALQPIGEKPTNTIVGTYPNAIISFVRYDVSYLLKPTIKANIKLADDREVSRAGSIPVVVEATNKAVAGGEAIGASLPNLRKNFSRHPSFELLRRFELRSKYKRIKARLIDISHRLRAAVGGGVVFHDILRIHMPSDCIAWILIIERSANVVGDKPRLSPDINRPQAVLVLVLEDA